MTGESNTPNVPPLKFADKYELGPLLAIQGKDGCDSPFCTRMVRQIAEGEWELGPCMGYHCPYCGEPCSMMGHKKCLESDPREVGV